MDLIHTPLGATIYRKSNANESGVNIHTYVEPTLGNATHVIEGPKSLILVDSQYFVSAARDFRQYVNMIDKPIALMIISHDHPDHYFGLSAEFDDVKAAALPDVAKSIKEEGPETLVQSKMTYGDQDLPNSVTYPKYFLQPGRQTYEGIEFDLKKVMNAEDEEQLVIDLPGLNTIIIQDLSYNGYHAHLFGYNEKNPKAWNPASWLNAIRSLTETPRGYVLVGHGAPTNMDVFRINIIYLTSVNSLLNYAKSPEEFAELLFYMFPDLKGRKIVDMYRPYLEQRMA